MSHEITFIHSQKRIIGRYKLPAYLPSCCNRLAIIRQKITKKKRTLAKREPFWWCGPTRAHLLMDGKKKSSYVNNLSRMVTPCYLNSLFIRLERINFFESALFFPKKETITPHCQAVFYTILNLL